MDLKEIKTKTENELQKLLADTRESLRVLRFKDANKQLKNIREIRQARIIISHILTVLNMKKKVK